MRIALSMLIALLLAVPVSAEDRIGGDKKAEPRDMAAVMQKRMPEIAFDNVGFADVIDFMRDVTGASIFVNWKAIEQARVDRNAPVAARLRDVPFEKVLRVILDSVSTPENKLDWTIDEGVITISTAADLQKNVETQVYDVRFLAEWRKKAAPATQPSDAKDPLIGMITGSIAPRSWAAPFAGKIDEKDGQLIVTATPENQKAVANLLENLKRLAN